MELAATPWSRKRRLDRKDIVRFQVLVHCHLEGLKVSNADLNSMTVLALRGTMNLKSFCETLRELNIYQSVQGARNAIGELEKLNLVTKEGVKKKTVSLSKDLQIVTEGNILVDIQCLCTDVS